MTRFLSNSSLWNELNARVRASRRVRAAVAFLGSGGADLLPLKKGDSLVVNLGLQAVKSGATSPKEIRKLIARGVAVFTRSNLHAKFCICDGALFTGSANVSSNSQNVLDEAAVLTTEKSALLRATDFFDKLCTEPVRPEYLKLCLQEYRPPLLSLRKKGSKSSGQKRVVEAKLWFISGLRYGDIPADEQQSAEIAENRAAKKLRKPKGTYVNYSHYAAKPRYFSDIRIGDWVVACIADSDGQRDVHPPEQVIGQDSYPRGKGKRRYLLLSEAPDQGQVMRLSQFRRRIRSMLPKLDTNQPRTAPITDGDAADFILGLWTATGRVATKRKTKARPERCS